MINALRERVEAVFQNIAATRMAGVPLLHCGLEVQAVGFALEPGGRVAVGVLVTPWFMNLLRLPLGPQAVSLLAPGAVGSVQMGAYRLSFIGAHEAVLGAYEMCSLASPMFEFSDQEAAVATAHEVLGSLRSSFVPGAHPDARRRRFLLGRGVVSGAESGVNHRTEAC